MVGPRNILIGVGSNLDTDRNVPRGLRLLRSAFPGVRTSTFYRTRPLHGLDQPPYVNGVVAAETTLSAADVRRVLRAVEDSCGRVRVADSSYASRTLDLDLLAYGDEALPEEGLPDGDLLERDFVLVPAAELWPAWRHPVAGRSLAELAAELFPVMTSAIETLPPLG